MKGDPTKHKNIAYEVYGVTGKYEGTFVNEDGAVREAKRVSGYVRKIPFDPLNVDPVADFRKRQEEQTPPEASKKEEGETCDDGSATKRYQVYDGNDSLLVSYDFLDAAKDEARRIAGLVRDCSTQQTVHDYTQLELGVYFDGELLSFHETIESAHAHARKAKALIILMDGDDEVLSNYCVPALNINYYVNAPYETFWYVREDSAIAHAESIKGSVNISHRGDIIWTKPPWKAHPVGNVRLIDERTGAFVVYNPLGEAVFDSDYLFEAICEARKMTEGSVVKAANYGRTLWIFVDGHQDMPPYCVCDCESLEGYIKCHMYPDAAKDHARKIKGFVRDYGAGTIAWDFRPCPDKVMAELGIKVEDRRSSGKLVAVSSLKKGQAFEFGASKLLKIEDESFLDMESLTRFKTGDDGNLVVGLDAMVRPINVKFVIED